MNLKTPWLSLALVATAVAIGALPGQGAGLDWQLGAEGWRLLTCQLTHWDADHLLWDALAVAILGGWSESRWPEVTRKALLIGLVLIPAVVVVAYPGLAFRGLSGLACTLAVTGAMGAWREARSAHDRLAMGVAGALLVGLAAKTLYEILTHDAVFAAATTWQPVPLAHLAGAAAGLVAQGPWLSRGYATLFRHALPVEAETSTRSATHSHRLRSAMP